MTREKVARGTVLVPRKEGKDRARLVVLADPFRCGPHPDYDYVPVTVDGTHDRPWCERVARLLATHQPAEEAPAP